MKYLGIDYGTKRVGLATSDASGTMAFPHSVIPNDDSMLDTVVTLIEKEGVGQVVIGQSHNLTGEPNTVQAAIDDFITSLTLVTPVPIDMQDERLSTQAAVQIQGKNNMTDASAAALILDSYMQKK